MKGLLIFTFTICTWQISFPQDYYEEGLKQYYLHENEDAIVFFNLAILNNQHLSKSYLMRGATRIHQGLFNQARQDLRSSMAIDSNDYKAYHYFGRTFLYEGSIDSAIIYFKIALNLNKSDSELFDDKAMAEVLSGNFHQAIRDENHAISIDSLNENYYSTRGYAKLLLFKYEDAISDFDLSIKVRPNQKAFANKGLALFNLKNFILAIENFSKALEFIKNDPEILYLRGISYFNIEKNDLACEDLTKSASLGYDLSNLYMSRVCKK